ncbi:MAG: hypothetical protein JXB19_10815 [Bacteroidales bacterium]|nr:hypothetical protein [Bacteroidales bacterium]
MKTKKNSALTIRMVTLILAAGIVAPAFSADTLNVKSEAVKDFEFDAVKKRLNNWTEELKSAIVYEAPATDIIYNEKTIISDRLDQLNGELENNLRYAVSAFEPVYPLSNDYMDAVARIDEFSKAVEKTLAYKVPFDQPADINSGITAVYEWTGTPAAKTE